MTDEQITEHMGWPIKAIDWRTEDLCHRVRTLVAKAEAEERERIAKLLDAAHEQRKHLDNYAAVYARLIRESKRRNRPASADFDLPAPNDNVEPL